MNMAMVTVDIGNTSIRFGLFSRVNMSPHSRPIRYLDLETVAPDWNRIGKWLAGESPFWTISSVHRQTEKNLFRWLTAYRSDELVRVLRHNDVSIHCAVENPRQLGMDRIMAAVAANALRDSQQPAIIVDAGSVITIDAVSSRGIFLGGAIFPGISMGAAALHQQTDQLPMVDCQLRQFGTDKNSHNEETDTFASNLTDVRWLPVPIGNSTENAIKSGLIWGSIGAIESLIHRTSSQLSGKPCLFLTGGDAEVIATRICPQVQVIPDLVLRGIALTEMELERG